MLLAKNQPLAVTSPPENFEPDTFTVSYMDDQQRLDSFLVKRFPQHSRVKLQRAIAAGSVLVDGQSCKSSTRLKEHQTVSCKLEIENITGPIPEDIPLTIIFEDDHLVAINKPTAMVVHPAKGHWAGTMTSALAFHFKNLSSVGGPTRPGIVHRLDRDTSGVILVAKTDAAHNNLASQFEKRTVEKEYLTIVSPAPNLDRDIIDKPIGEHPYQREKKAIRENHKSSRNAISRYEIVERFDGFALVEVRPKTGRTHQIRVHMAHIGSSVVCDRLYSGRARLTVKDLDRQRGADTMLMDRQALHAHRIRFAHPDSGETMELKAELPEDFERLLESLREHRSLSK